MAQSIGQLRLFESDSLLTFHKAAGTFTNNHSQEIHRWYPYIEGYSYDLVENILDSLPARPQLLYDPFGGSGTTLLVASEHGIQSVYSEINPFMRFVTDCKVNHVRAVINSGSEYGQLVTDAEALIDFLMSPAFVDACEHVSLTAFSDAFGERLYFEDSILRQVLVARNWIMGRQGASHAFLLLALSAVLVQVSNLIRRADLRYRRAAEFRERGNDLRPILAEKIRTIIADISARQGMVLAPTQLGSIDARELPEQYMGQIDVVITSPPYLNGTNYFRNTKLELWLSGFLRSEHGLKTFRSAAITAGINNVSSRIRPTATFEEVEVCAKQLDEVAYDSRIPTLVRAYFSDMYQVFVSLAEALRPGGRVYLDIGDSIFAGVHVPTHELLIAMSERAGLSFVSSHELRKRHSNGGQALTQVLLQFEKPNQQKPLMLTHISTDKTLAESAAVFESELPYQQVPYSKRNWGHPLHSLCSYQGKMKPSLAHFLVSDFTKPGDTILDPLAGVGTIPFEACLQGRVGIANDISSVAYANSLAKVSLVDVTQVEAVIDDVNAYIHANLPSVEEVNAIKLDINGPLQAYYETQTLREVVAARSYFLRHPAHTGAEAMVFASLLHILHGNRPYALSRRSHPITPFAPTGEFEYRALIPRLMDKAMRSAQAARPETFVEGMAIQGSYDELGKRGLQVDAVITSPPFYGSTRFYLANWLRLWFSGWEQSDFTGQREEYLERKQQKDMDVYRDFFTVCETSLRPGGRLIIHLGKSRRCDMGEELAQRLPDSLRLDYRFDEDVSEVEKHGVSDKGVTHAHQYLFITRQ